MTFSKLAAAALACATAMPMPASAALTFDWSFVITSGDGIGQRVTGTLEGLEEGDNYSSTGAPIRATITTAPTALVLGAGEYAHPYHFQYYDNQLAFTVKDGKITYASAVLTRFYGDGERQEQIWFGGYGLFRPQLTAVAPDNSTLFQGSAFRSRTEFTPRPVAVDPSAVPEPATWATMILGFGLVGAAARRRRARTVAA